jgi:hypothetical protein
LVARRGAEETGQERPGDRRASEVLIRRICVRYEDDRKVCFVPEAGEEYFS